ncbi:hypothetical protein ACFFIX_02325 [Metabacillus herbersteinensis]|uniref:Radical SAM protein n=1 Tax=Metabacillus herbersteinensis TaxID=283816 RepID=A0ABV6G9E0_9BACI
MEKYFIYNSRLKIKIPDLDLDWNLYDHSKQQAILLEWEIIRGSIPDRIAELEDEINGKQEQLNNEDDFKKSCEINENISELASIINDLWLWFRMSQSVSFEKAHN